MKNVLLVGIYGVFNYGCEAIVRGTVNILKEIDPSIKVSYASYNYKDDKRRLSDCDVTIINRQFPRKWSFRNILEKCLLRVGIRCSAPFDTTHWVGKFDAVFSIGGDIYTIWPNNGYNRKLPQFLEKCQKKGLKYILWGASVGKFESNPEALLFFKEHLRKIDLIVLREPESKTYLKSLGIEQNVVMAPDPAFSVGEVCVPKKKGKLQTIGINLSPLSSGYKYNDYDSAIVAQADAVMRIIDMLNVDVLFLPHVVKTHKLDDDYSYMLDIRNKLPESYQKRVSIIDDDPQFVGLKKDIDRCDFVIAARMHCAINAVTRGCPTLLLSYSEKAKGMAEFIYGNRNAVVDLNSFENMECLKSTIEEWNQQILYDKITGFDYKSIFDENVSSIEGGES